MTSVTFKYANLAFVLRSDVAVVGIFPFPVGNEGHHVDL